MTRTTHTLSVLVEDKPGVLARVAALFSRRGFNIESLAVGPTEHPAVSRMTIVVAVEGLPLEQVTSSWLVIWKQPSPSIAHTVASGRPTLAPMAAGTA